MPWAKFTDPPNMSTKDDRLAGTRARKIMQRLRKQLCALQVRTHPNPDVDAVFGVQSRPSPMVSIEANDLLVLAAFGVRDNTDGDVQKDVPQEVLVYKLMCERQFIMQTYAILVEMFLGYRVREMNVDTVLEYVNRWISDARNDPSKAAY